MPCAAAAVGLAVQDQRIDREADIVDRRTAPSAPAGLGVDLDLADMRARRKRADRHGLVADPVELAAQSRPADRCASRRLGDVEDADARSVPLTANTPRANSTSIADLQQVRGDRAAFLDDRVGRRPMAGWPIRIERPECEPPPA